MKASKFKTYTSTLGLGEDGGSWAARWVGVAGPPDANMVGELGGSPPPIGFIGRRKQVWQTVM